MAKSQEQQPGSMIIKVSILGVTPLMMNPANEAVLNSLPGSGIARAGRKPRNDEETREDIAAKRVIHGPNGEVGLPVEYLYGALRNAGQFVIYDGKKKVTNAEGKTLLFAFMTVQELFLPFKDQKEEYTIDIRRGVLKNSGKPTAVAVVRPKFARWAFDCTVEVDTTQIHIDKVRQLFDEAGKKIGLGDFRNGPFGRFRVEKWEAKGQVLAAAA